MKPGLAQGYVELDSAQAEILRIVHRHGPMRQCDLVEELGVCSRQEISSRIGRLLRAGFLHDHGKISFKLTGERTQRLFGVLPGSTSNAQALTNYERNKRCRKNRKMRVASVFHFRGSFKV